MDLSMLFQRVGKVAAENTPAILTALGVSGTITTAYLAAKAAFSSVEVLERAEEKKKSQESLDEILDEETKTKVETSEEYIALTKREKVEAVWHLYAPAVASGALTIAAIILAARVQERRNAALAAAYTTVEKSYSEYRNKNIERLGKKKEQELRAQIAQDRINKTPPTQASIIVTGKGTSLCKDEWSGRYFYSSVTVVDKAVNDFNSKILRDGYGSLSEFWSYLDLPPVTESNIIGWSADKLMEIEWSGTIGPDEEPSLAYDFRVLPNPRFASAF